MTSKFAGVTLDWYDDQGVTLKEKFPHKQSLPSFIKEADIRSKEKLPNEAFALVMVDSGHVFRKFACNDPGTTAMSTIYFMEHGDKLPEDAKKLAASNLVDACVKYGLLPPAAMTKAASEAIPGGKADNKPNSSDFPQGEIAMGKKVEMEHTDTPARAEEISRDHLTEFPDYYTRLKKMEDEAKKSMDKKADSDEGGRAPTPEEKNKIQQWMKTHDNPKDEDFHAFAEGMGLNVHLAEGVAYDMAHELSKNANIIDITGKLPRPKVKKASLTNEDFALVLPDGTRKYPINNWDMVKKAEQYFQENGIRMAPEHRRQYAANLAKKAFIIGYPLDEDITSKGARSYHSVGMLKSAVEMRKIACEPGYAREFLDELFEKRAGIQPEVFAECLRQFDVDQGLDTGWDRVILNPWESTFGIDKRASVVWEEGADRVTDGELKNLADNHKIKLRDMYGDDMVEEFIRNPVEVFNSMPDPEKKLIARLADDLAHSGKSEASVG